MRNDSLELRNVFQNRVFSNPFSLGHYILTCMSCIYSGTFLIWTPLGQKKVSLLVRCPDVRGCNVHKQGIWDSQMCPVYRGVLISGVS